MFSMIGKSVLFGLAATRAVHAHTQMMDMYVNGVGSGDSTAIRMSYVQGAEGSPINDVTSNDMACNVGGSTGVSRVLNIKADDTLTFEWRSYPDDVSKVPIDPSHKGPCSVYMKKVDDAIKDPGHGDGWFKIWAEGYDGQWCSGDKLNANRAHVSVKLPENILGGYYLIRPEILALHAAQAPDYNPQFYASCVQVFIDSDGNMVPTETVSIPGYVKKNDAALTYNIYAKSLPEYPLPGPDVATFTAAGNSKVATQASQTQGEKPADCVLVAGNICFTELPDYTNEAGCWAASKDCYTQNENCWAKAGLAAMHYCQTWEDKKCKPQDNLCNGKDFTGPKNKGQAIDPKPSTLAVSGVAPAQTQSAQPTAVASSGSGSGSSAAVTSAAAATTTKKGGKASATSTAQSSYSDDTQVSSSNDSSDDSEDDAADASSPAAASITAAPKPWSGKGADNGVVTVTEDNVVTYTAFTTIYMRR